MPTTMAHQDTKRISRLTAILTQLQAKRILSASELAAKFSVSTRTIYRDIRALEQAGVPVMTEEGKGYALMEHYRLPPLTFTESEANALISAAQWALKNKDASFVKTYSEAIDKVKAVLHQNVRDKANLLAERIYFAQNENDERTSNHLSSLQFALTNFHPSAITYTNEAHHTTSRVIEPFALLSTTEKWLLIAWCRLRGAFRFFRLDRMTDVVVLAEKFEPHNLTLEAYFQKYH